MKRKFIIVFIIITIAIGCIIFYSKVFCKVYRNGENDNFKLKVGETFKIRLYQNGSTGYENCWLNEMESQIVKRVYDEYEPGLNSMLGAVGAGGTVIYTFKAISKGNQIIKMASCPVGPENKKCQDYSDNTKPDNEFVINIVE